MVMTSDNPPLFIDTNTLIRATVVTAPDHNETSAVLKRLWEAKITLWVSTQVLREYAAVLTRPQTYTSPAPSKIIAGELRVFQNQFNVAEDSKQVSERLITLMETIPVGGKQIHDANIAAAMQVYRISHLLTFNPNDFERFKGFITSLNINDAIQIYHL
jgi:predicted nucleic acid-binding protein